MIKCQPRRVRTDGLAPWDEKVDARTGRHRYRSGGGRNVERLSAAPLPLQEALHVAWHSLFEGPFEKGYL